MQINYNQKKSRLEIVLRIFTDDLQTELNTNSNTLVELATERTPRNIADRYHKYLKKNLSFSINSNPKPFEYIGSEYENKQIVFYLEIPKIDTLKNLSIQNKILNQVFKEQKNIVKIRAYSREMSNILHREKTTTFIKF